MSIKTEGDKMIIHFGKGDVVVAKTYRDKEMKTTPYVMFFKADTGKIGSRPEFRGHHISGDLKMFFDKVESIDVVINAFLEFKESWLASKEEVQDEQ